MVLSLSMADHFDTMTRGLLEAGFGGLLPRLHHGLARSAAWSPSTAPRLRLRRIRQTMEFNKKSFMDSRVTSLILLVALITVFGIHVVVSRTDRQPPRLDMTSRTTSTPCRRVRASRFSTACSEEGIQPIDDEALLLPNHRQDACPSSSRTSSPTRSYLRALLGEYERAAGRQDPGELRRPIAGQRRRRRRPRTSASTASPSTNTATCSSSAWCWRRKPAAAMSSTSCGPTKQETVEYEISRSVIHSLHVAGTPAHRRHVQPGGDQRGGQSVHGANPRRPG